MPKTDTANAYLKLHHQTYNFRYRIPEDVRPFFGGKHEILQTLSTNDLRIANIRKMPLVDLAKSKIRAVRNNDPTAFKKTALYWHQQLTQAGNDEAMVETLTEQMLDDAINLHIPGGWKAIGEAAGANPDLFEVIKGMPQAKRVQAFINTATGKTTPTLGYFDQWFDSYSHVTQKTREMAASEVQRFADKHPTLSEINKSVVTRWIEQRKADGLKAATIRRSLAHLTSYWRYLQNHEIVSGEVNPFGGHKIKTGTKTGQSSHVRPWSNDEIAILLKEAKWLGNQQLQSLILIAAYSGMRIEEICSMKLDDVQNGIFSMVDAKTPAGLRDIPVHRKIKNLISVLMSNSADGYLISNLGIDKLGRRSINIGKKFGRMKTRLGFKAREQIFHSFRHSFSTALLRADVRTVTVDLLMGHKTDRMAIDRYSDGISPKQKREAIEKIDYQLSKGLYKL